MTIKKTIKTTWHGLVQLPTFDGLTVKPDDFYITGDKYWAKYEPILCQFKLLTIEQCMDIFGNKFSVGKIDKESDEYKEEYKKSLLRPNRKWDPPMYLYESKLYPVTYLYPNQKIINYEREHWGSDRNPNDENWKMYEKHGYWIQYGLSVNDFNKSAGKRLVARMQKQLKLEKELKDINDKILNKSNEEN